MALLAAQSLTGPKLRVSPWMQEKKLVGRVEPVYPELARQARIQGTVRLGIIVAKNGSVKQVTLLSGHPLLVPPAMDAVRYWRYDPTLRDGEPVEVASVVEIHFSLSSPLDAPSRGVRSLPRDPRLLVA